MSNLIRCVMLLDFFYSRDKDALFKSVLKFVAAHWVLYVYIWITSFQKYLQLLCTYNKYCNLYTKPTPP